MVRASAQNRDFYSEIAPWWRLISPPGDYEEEAAFVLSQIRTAPMHVRDVLELGSGGGNNAFHLKSCFNMMLIDNSDHMLEVSRRLNPDCVHAPGDLRTIRLDRQFDAVFIHDAVDSMLNEHDLSQAIQTAYTHCKPEALAIFVPDHTRESYQPSTEHGGTDDMDGRGARYLAWTWDPNPTDTSVVTEYAFLLREADGTTSTLHQSHKTGLFDRNTWLRLIREAGFEAESVDEKTSEDREPREIFIGRRPPD